MPLLFERHPRGKTWFLNMVFQLRYCWPPAASPFQRQKIRYWRQRLICNRALRMPSLKQIVTLTEWARPLS